MRQELDQAELRQHRGGLIGGLQAVLQRQDLARDLVLRDALGVGDQVLQRGLGLGLPRLRILHRVLRGGKIGLDVLHASAGPVASVRLAAMRSLSAATAAAELVPVGETVTAA